MARVEHQSIIVDSAQRRLFNTTTASHFEINYTAPIQLRSKRSTYYMKLLNLEFPTSFPQVDANFNTFVVDEWNGVSTFTNTVTVPTGTYLADELALEVETQLDATSTASGQVNDYVVSVSDITGHVTITYTGGSTFITVKGTGTLNSLLGFTTSDSETAAAGVDLTGPNYVKLKTKRYALIKSSISSSTFHTIDGEEPIIAHIPLKSGRGTIERYDNNNHDTPYVKIDDHSNLSKITFTVVDDLGRLIDFDGLEWSCVIQFYKQPHKQRITMD